MTISFSGQGSDGQDQYSVSGSVWQSDGGIGVSLSLSKQAPAPAEEPVSTEAKPAEEAPSA